MRVLKLVKNKKNMRNKIIIFLCVGLILYFLFPKMLPASFHQNADNDKIEYVEGEIILYYKSELPNYEIINHRKDIYGMEIIESIEKGRIELLKTIDGETTEQAINRIKNNPEIEHIQPNYTYQTFTNDTYFSHQWSLKNTGQSVLGSKGVEGIDLDIFGAWEYSKGSEEIIVAVIDTGVDIYHPDLSENIWINSLEIDGDGVDNDGNGYIDDIHGWDFYNNTSIPYQPSDDENHGTHISGTIAAIADNGIGIAGVAPNIKIMVLKFIGPNGEGTTVNAIKAIQYAKQMGAQIINASWGGYENDVLLYSEISDYDGLFIAAAGNDGKNLETKPVYPACFDLPNIITVASINNKGNLSSFSNFSNTKVDLGAPGEHIIGCLQEGVYGYMSGTSMATPHVSAIAALILSINNSLVPEEVIEIINQNTVALTSLEGKTKTNGMANANLSAIKAHELLPVPISMFWSLAPDKKIYLIGKNGYMKGEELDLSGGLITLVFSDNTTEKILLNSENFTITGYQKEKQTTGDSTQIIKVQYEGIEEEITYEIRVLMLGDVNNDGVINSTDALIVLKYEAQLTSLSEEQYLVSEMNSDGIINSTDALVLLKYEAQLLP